nr:EAL domain-containing protein [Chenggangzhangella methanolivorans]
MPFSAPAFAHELAPFAFAAVASLCLIGGALAVYYLGRLTDPQDRASRTSAAVIAAVTVAATIWCAHVVAILGVDGSALVGYDPRMTAAAAVVALVTAALAMTLYGANGGSAASAGVALGAGVAAVHYVGVAAMRGPGRFALENGELAIGVALSVGAAAGAFWIAAKIERRAGFALATALFAAGVTGFHVIAADALSFAANPRLAPSGLMVGQEALELVAALVFAAVVIGASVGPALRARLSSGRSAARERAFADLTREGIVICEDARIVDVNLAAARFVGLDPSVMRARALRDFLDAPDPDRILSASLAKPQEVAVKAMGGEASWVEISSRDVAIENRQRRVFTLRDLSEQKRNEHQIRHLAYHDPLTGLANRAAFGEALSSALKRGGEVALFCVDLDKFKEVNDVFGHSAGDDILRTAARRLTAAAPDCMAFRLGGDEFVMIGTGADAGDADKVALRVTERLNTDTVVAGRTIRCGASVGYAVYPHHGGDVDTLFSNADAALYRAKADGRGLARGFEPEMDLALRERRALQQDLTTAITRGEMFLHWMPQANAKTGEIVGFEALIRWKHPTRGVVPPVQFVPVAEETAAIVPIGEWVLRTACREGMKWAKPGKVAVNLSPVQFQHGDIVELVHSILIETGLPAARLELEITEGVLLDNLTGALNTLRRLKALGVQIAMDDFGTGYSSLSYLQAFPFDRIKTPRSSARSRPARRPRPSCAR